MNKNELVKLISLETKIPQKTVRTMLNAFSSIIAETLAKKEPVPLVGFGTFCVTERIARRVQNNFTGKEMIVQEALIPKFRAGSVLKNICQKYVASVSEPPQLPPTEEVSKLKPKKPKKTTSKDDKKTKNKKSR